MRRLFHLRPNRGGHNYRVCLIEQRRYHGINCARVHKVAEVADRGKTKLKSRGLND